MDMRPLFYFLYDYLWVYIYVLILSNAFQKSNWSKYLLFEKYFVLKILMILKYSMKIFRIKSVSWEYSCDEEYLEEFNKGNFFKYRKST